MKRCPRCKTEVKEDQKYCHECGYYLKAKKPNIKEIAFATSFILIFLVVSILFFLNHYTEPKEEISGAEVEEVKHNEKEIIQVKYINAYKNLLSAINSGDINKSIDAMEEFKRTIKLVEKEINKEHVEIIAPSKVLEVLEDDIKKGNLEKAKEDIKDIGSTCGVELCHSQTGMLMFRFASMYYEIKRDVEKGNLEDAAKKIPEFRERFEDFRSAMMVVMPLETKIRMKEEYIDSLDRSIKNKNKTEAERIIKEIGESMCAVRGCHSILLTTEILSK